MRRATRAICSLAFVLAVLPFALDDPASAAQAPAQLEASTANGYPDGVPAGGEMRFHAWVRSDAPASSSSNGTVTLRMDGNVIGSETIPANDNSVYITTPGFTRGDKIVVAEYSGGPAWGPSEATIEFTVVGRYTEGALSINDCSTKYTPPGSGGSAYCHAVGGEQTTLEFLFDRWWEWQGEDRPTGEVVFTASAPPSAYPSGFGPVVVARAMVDGVQAVAHTRDLPIRAKDGTVGCYTVRADYEGDGLFNPLWAAQGICVSPPDDPEAPIATPDGEPPTTSTTGRAPSPVPDRDPRGENIDPPDAVEDAVATRTPLDGRDVTGPSTSPTSAAPTTIERASTPFDGTATTRTSNDARGPLTAAAAVVTTIAFGLSLAAAGVGPWTPGSSLLR